MLDIGEFLDGMTVEAAATRSTPAEMGDDKWGRSIVANGEERAIGHLSRHGTHDLWHHLARLWSIASTFGAASPAQTGKVIHPSSSAGLAPKAAVEPVEITAKGWLAMCNGPDDTTASRGRRCAYGVPT